MSNCCSHQESSSFKDDCGCSCHIGDDFEILSPHESSFIDFDTNELDSENIQDWLKPILPDLSYELGDVKIAGWPLPTTSNSDVTSELYLNKPYHHYWQHQPLSSGSQVFR